MLTLTELSAAALAVDRPLAATTRHPTGQQLVAANETAKRISLNTSLSVFDTLRLPLAIFIFAAVALLA